MNDLREAYAACEAVLTRSGSSFAMPIRLLPRAKRLATTALYAWCRVADDIADAVISGETAAGPADPAAALAGLRESLAEALDSGRLSGTGAAGDDTVAVLRAVADATRRYGIPRRYLFDILDGVEMDLSPREFVSFRDLEDYCRKVASAVGLAAIHIWGFRSDAAFDPAHACGMAFQLTNVIRDVLEDAVAGRVYLPTEDFEACGADRSAWLASAARGSAVPPGTGCVLGRLRDAATHFYAAARPLDALLSTDGKIVFRAMYGSYAAIFRQLQSLGDRVLVERKPTAKARVAAAAAACVVLGPRWPAMRRGAAR